ncbi:MAG: hypothetical protein QNK37_15570 [Acidobacteriota bacterium]|nr:hypothetical protein [Acidobacteriota bacterium]
MRRLSCVWKVFLLALIGFPIFFFHPMFQNQELEPVKMEDFNERAKRRGLDLLAEFVRNHQEDLRDSWGLMYGPSQFVEEEEFSSRTRVCQTLNKALTEMDADQLSIAKTRLLRFHNGYDSQFIPGGNDNDLLPASETDRILYALFRYNRSVLLSDLAERNSRGPRREYGLLRRALFDLRRTVAATELLGQVRDNNGTYWGEGVPAWEGGRLLPEHGDLATYHIYTNLAVVYLRLGKKEGYPGRTLGYLRREQLKYSYGDDDTLSPMITSLIGTCLKQGDDLPIGLFRLTMALHNMEAAARGMNGSNGDEDIFNYTIGILLAHLAEYEESGITLSDAARFHNHARRMSNPNREVYHLAAKEELLALLGADRLEEAGTLLEQIDLGELDAAIGGPDRERNRVFLDLAQFQNLLHGRLDPVKTYLERRRLELKDRTVINLHERAAYNLGRAYGAVLVSTLREHGTGRIAATLHLMEGQADMEHMIKLQHGIKDETRALKLDPRVTINLWMRKHPDWQRQIRLGGYLALLLFLAYLAWVYQSHRKVARRILHSEYGRELM